MVVGMSAIVDLRVLGFARRLPMAPLERYFPVIWAGFWASAISGAILFAADATSKIVSPLFGVKMLAIVFGVLTMVVIRRTVFRDPSVTTPVGRHGKNGWRPRRSCCGSRRSPPAG